MTRPLSLKNDVLATGADAILVDGGHCGTRPVTATAGPRAFPDEANTGSSSENAFREHRSPSPDWPVRTEAVLQAVRDITLIPAE